MICRLTGQPCQTSGICAPFGGCSQPRSEDRERLATWVGLFIGTGIDMGISKQVMLKALTPTKLAKIYDVLDSTALSEPERLP